MDGKNDLALSAYRVFGNATKQMATLPNLTIEPFEDLKEDLQDAWVRVGQLSALMSESGVEEAAAQVAARLHYGWWMAVHGRIAPHTFDELPLPVQIAWEAVARHLAYLVSDLDEHDDLGSLELQWGPWAEQKHAALLAKGVHR